MFKLRQILERLYPGYFEAKELLDHDEPEELKKVRGKWTIVNSQRGTEIPIHKEEC